MVEFEVSADKSTAGSENEGFPLTQLLAERCSARRQQRQQKTTSVPLPYELINVLFAFSTYHEYSSYHPMTFQNVFQIFFYQINLPVAVCVIKLICLPKG